MNTTSRHIVSESSFVEFIRSVSAHIVEACFLDSVVTVIVTELAESYSVDTALGRLWNVDVSDIDWDVASAIARSGHSSDISR